MAKYRVYLREFDGPIEVEALGTDIGGRTIAFIDDIDTPPAAVFSLEDFIFAKQVNDGD